VLRQVPGRDSGRRARGIPSAAATTCGNSRAGIRDRESPKRNGENSIVRRGLRFFQRRDSAAEIPNRPGGIIFIHSKAPLDRGSCFARGFPHVNPPFARPSSRSGPSDRQVRRRDRLQPRAASFARGVQLGESVFAVSYLDIFASSSPCFFPSFSFCRRGGIDDRSSSALRPTMRDSRRLRTA